MHLLADDVEVKLEDTLIVKTVTDNGDDTYTVTFTNLPKYRDGVEIKYTVKEDAIDNYTADHETAADGETIVNTHDIDRTETQVTKIWDDSENQKFTRPDTITLKLLANNVEYASFAIGEGFTRLENDAYTAVFTLVDKDTWTLKVTNLPAFKDGVAQSYTWLEDDLPEGYTIGAWDVSPEGETTITNTYKPERMCLTVLKVWDDDNNSAGFRPESIEVVLTAKAGDSFVDVTKLIDMNGNAVTDRYTLDESNHWSAIVLGLPIYENEIEITYSWVEDKFENDTLYEEPLTATDTTGRITYLTNTYKPDTTEATVVKTWVENELEFKSRPEAITAVLKNGDKIVATVILNEGNGWTATVTDLPKYENGEEIVYTWDEPIVPENYNKTKVTTEGTETTITNTRKTGSLEITKAFIGIPEDANVDSLKFRILGPCGFDQTVTYADFTGGTYKLDGLVPGRYTVYEIGAETLLPNVRLISSDSVTITNADVPENGTGTAALTNAYENINTKFVVVKRWEDKDDLDHSRPQYITVNLLDESNAVVDTVTLSEANGWTAESKEVPKSNASGEDIKYRWEEVAVEGYTSATITAGNVTVITNTHEPKLTSVTVRKVWLDNNNASGRRPTSLTVKLYPANMTFVLNEENNWSVTVVNLPMYDFSKPDPLIRYTWGEPSIPGYRGTIIRDGDITTITNKLITPPGEPPVVIPETEPVIVEVLINHVGDCFD